MSTIDEYWDALERLKNNQPIYCSKGEAINNDTVALEAGRKRGSIKKSRPRFAKLIVAINKAAKSAKPDNAKVSKERSKKDYYRELYHESLNRELMLIERLTQLEKKIKSYENVLPLR